MDETEFDQLNRLAEKAFDKFEALYASGAFAELEEALHRVSLALGERFSVSLDLNLSVFDAERGKSLGLLNTGLTGSAEGRPYRTQGDSTVHRYIVDGFIQTVPHDCCPHCWANWDFKLLRRTCPECGYELGKQVKLLLDTDICPHCERGHVSRTNPTCPECSFTVEPELAVWG